MLQKLCRHIKRLTCFVVCAPNQSPARGGGGFSRRRRTPRLGPLTATCLLLAAFPLCAVYLNAVPAGDEESTTAIRPPTVANRSRMFANQILSGEDRRMIVLVGEAGADFEPVERLLASHSRTLFLGDVDNLPSLRTLSMLGADRGRLLASLMDCSKDSLAHLVDYANDRLVDAGEAPWCSLRLRRSQREDAERHGGKDVFCRPATKLRFTRLCRANHIAVRLSSRTAADTYLGRDDVKPCCYRIVHVHVADTTSSSGIDSGGSVHAGNVSLIAGGSSQDIDGGPPTRREYPSGWFGAGNVADKIVELFNFLDLYLDDQTLHWLEFLGHKVALPDAPPRHRLSAQKSNSTRSRVAPRKPPLPIEVM